MIDDTGFDLDGPFTAPPIPTDDDAVVRRVKAVSATGPLHDLERNKASYEGDFWGGYDLVSLAVAAIDQVALAMGVSAGMLYDEARVYVAGQAARQQSAADAAESDAVADRVLGALITVEPHTTTYALHEGEAVQRRVHGFRLLYEQWSADESVHLRASEDAINVLVDALDLDVTSAQIAAEVQMRVLIERNALAGAVTVARRARYQSIQYLERVRTVVRDTGIDPDSFDWEKEVPEFLTSALDHVIDRIHGEGELVVAVEEQRDAAASPEVRRTANQLIAMLRECSNRHTELQRHLMSARGQLRQSQDERLSRPPGSVRRADLEADLVVPLMAAGLCLAAPLGDTLFAAFAAPRQPIMASLAVLIDELLAEAAERSEGEPEPEPVFGDDPTPWWEPYWDVAEDLLTETPETARLSELLARARAVAAADRYDDVVLDADVLAAAVCHLTHGLLGARVADAGSYLLLAVTTGTRVTDAVVEADDLLVVRAEVVRPGAATAVAPLDLSVPG